jgi:hypothetical protein
LSYPITKQIREEKRKEAEARNALYNKLSLKDKLANAGEKVIKKLLSKEKDNE